MLRFDVISVEVERQSVRLSKGGEDPHETLRSRCEQILNNCWVPDVHGHMVKVPVLSASTNFVSHNYAVITVGYDAVYYFGDTEDEQVA